MLRMALVLRKEPVVDAVVVVVVVRGGLLHVTLSLAVVVVVVVVVETGTGLVVLLVGDSIAIVGSKKAVHNPQTCRHHLHRHSTVAWTDQRSEVPLASLSHPQQLSMGHLIFCVEANRTRF